MAESSDIRIDKEGIWYYRGAEMFRKDILSIFFQNLQVDGEGKYSIVLGDECCYLDVEDTAFVVTTVNKVKLPKNNGDCLEIILNDECSEALDLNSLSAGQDNVLYCRVKEGKFPARFSRKSYYQLAEFIEENQNKYFIRQNGEKYYVKINK